MLMKIAEWNRFLFLKMDEDFPFGNTRCNCSALKDPLSPGRGGASCLQILLG